MRLRLSTGAFYRKAPVEHLGSAVNLAMRLSVLSEPTSVFRFVPSHFLNAIQHFFIFFLIDTTIAGS